MAISGNRTTLPLGVYGSTVVERRTASGNVAAFRTDQLYFDVAEFRTDQLYFDVAEFRTDQLTLTLLSFELTCFTLFHSVQTCRRIGLLEFSCLHAVECRCLRSRAFAAFCITAPVLLQCL